MGERRLPTVVDSILDNVIGKHPIPTPNQQIAYGRDIRAWMDWPTGPDQAPKKVVGRGRRARDRMVLGNMGLVIKCARPYQHRAPMEELIQEGAISLQHAAEMFDPCRGWLFSTYAFWWIKQGIKRAVNDRSSLIRVPVNTTDDVHRVKKVLSTATEQLSKAQLVEMAGLKTIEGLERVQAAMKAQGCGSTSVRLESGHSLEDILPCATQGKQQQYEKLEQEEQQEQLWRLLALLPAEESSAMQLRLIHELSQQETANLMADWHAPKTFSTSQVGVLTRRGEAHLKTMWERVEAGLPALSSEQLLLV